MGILQSKKNVSLICCGLDNSGKSTIINQLKPQKKRESNLGPTPGYQVESFEKGNVSFKCFDMGGAKRYRNLWEKFFPDVDGVIFVVDSQDTFRMVSVKEELDHLLSDASLAGTPILFFANKMDLPGAMTPSDCVEKLDLTTLCATRSYNIFASNALTGEGLDAGLDWLSKTVHKD
eukprot:NODE_4504_length_793_cov_5.884409_g3739_i0.p1 GENE.NODE_4504_length_793_cov_5.884409_g3739_i0~~NODE_4504_length_793_cov_5.884409_g3739_i0.p1  ORF type:complete len:176 (-),score=42.25 NODE_4504_length_793_cov_5.884409_g3739_i0:72-599(-)